MTVLMDAPGNMLSKLRKIIANQTGQLLSYARAWRTRHVTAALHLRPVSA
jgi:hypothetical protein